MRAPCRPGQPIAVRGQALGPPWGKGGANGSCRMWGCRAGEVRSDSVWAGVVGGRRAGQGLTVLHLTRAGDPVGGDREQCVKVANQ